MAALAWQKFRQSDRPWSVSRIDPICEFFFKNKKKSIRTLARAHQFTPSRFASPPLPSPRLAHDLLHC